MLPKQYSAPWHYSFTVFTEIWINIFFVLRFFRAVNQSLLFGISTVAVEIVHCCISSLFCYYFFRCFVRTNHLLSKRIFRSVSFLSVSSLASSSEWRRSKKQTSNTLTRNSFSIIGMQHFYSCFVGIVQVHRSSFIHQNKWRKRRKKQQHTIQNHLEFSVWVCECVENKRKYVFSKVKKWLFVGRSTVIQNTGISVGCCNRPTDTANLTSQLSATHIDTRTHTLAHTYVQVIVSAWSLCVSRGQNGNEQKYVIITRSRRKKRRRNGSRKMQ